MPNNNPCPTCTTQSAAMRAALQAVCDSPRLTIKCNPQWTDEDGGPMLACHCCELVMPASKFEHYPDCAYSIAKAALEAVGFPVHAPKHMEAAKPAGPLYERILAALQSGPMAHNEEWIARQIAELVEEATRELREERDALAAALELAGGIPSTHDDNCALGFASAMRMKLERQRQRGYGGWENPSKCPVNRLSGMLASHLAKPDVVDVANFCMMLYFRDGGPEAMVQEFSARDARVRAEGKREGLEEAYIISRGCHDYGGGYMGEMYDAYHHGMDTVGRVIQERLKGADDLQMRVVLKVGEAAQAGEVANAD